MSSDGVAVTQTSFMLRHTTVRVIEAALSVMPYEALSRPVRLRMGWTDRWTFPRVI